MKVSSPMVRLLVVAIVAATMTVATAYAQQGGGRGGRGFGGGFGGRGGGPMGGDPTFGLLRSDEVIAELKITDEQKTALEKLAEQARPTRPDGDFRTMSEEERTKAFEKMRTDAEAKMAEMKEQLDEVLLPDQTDRLKQIVLQVRGTQALDDPEIAKELGITEDQKKEFTKVREEMQTKMREMFTNRDQNTNMQEAFGTMRTDTETKMLAVLTPEQKAQFEKMKGVKFDMPERAMGFGGRGGPGGGGPGGARGGRGGGRPQRPAAAE